MERIAFVRRMKDFAFFVQALAFQNQIASVFVELFEMRPDFVDVGTMRGKVERVVLEFVEFLLERRMLSHQVAMRGREGLRHHILLAQLDHVTRSGHWKRSAQPPAFTSRYGAAMFISAFAAPQTRLFASGTGMRFEFRSGRFESCTATSVKTAMWSRASRGCPASIAACAPRKE